MFSSNLRSVRFRISLLLLLSALNAVAMMALAVVILTRVSQGPDEELISTASRVSQQLSRVHDEALLPGESPAPLEDLVARLEALDAALAGAGEPTADARLALGTYTSKLQVWYGAGRPEHGPAVVALEEAERYAIGALYGVIPNSQMEWADAARRIMPWVVGWTFLVALATVVMSGQLRSLLSNPLERLAGAAGRVSAGDLKAPIPNPGGSPEIQQLSGAMESMRNNLADFIARLDEQNQEMKTMLGALTDGVLFLDDSGHVLEHNPRAQEILDGLPSAGALLTQGIQLRDAFPQLPRRIFDEATEREVQLPVTLLGDADQRHIAFRVFPVAQERSGYRKVYVAVIRDITEAVEVEAVKRDFLSVVTHELKTPLTAIDGFVRLLLIEKAGPLTERQRKALEMVRDQSGVMQQMVQDLLDATRLEGGSLKMESAPVDVALLLDQVGQSFAPGADAKGLTLDWDLDGARGARILGDDFRLQQVLGNLIRNAIKFTPEGGRVTLEAAREDDEVLIRVRDTGRGIPSDAQPLLFRKFYQVHRGDTRVAGGTGLGLYICSRLTHGMGGSIGVESAVGEGSCFILRFPCLDSSPRATRAPVKEVSL
ncbi:MAG: HAMP domain-containing protein [Alphaproteobacteria bacterium]|nr:HAMP domain-containing protein [Alphaproteobacteria bacterium]